MMNQQLLDYIKQMSAFGKSQNEIKDLLLKAGWNSLDIDENFNTLFSEKEQDIQKSPEKLQSVVQLLKISLKIYKSNFLTMSSVIGLFFIL